MAVITIDHEVIAGGTAINISEVGTNDWYVTNAPPPYPNWSPLAGSSLQKRVNGDNLLDNFEWVILRPFAGASDSLLTVDGPAFSSAVDDAKSVTGVDAAPLFGYQHAPGAFGHAGVGIRQVIRADRGTRTLHLWFMSYYGNVTITARFSDGSASETAAISGTEGTTCYHLTVQFSANQECDLFVDVYQDSILGSGDGLGFSSFRFSGAATSLVPDDSTSPPPPPSDSTFVKLTPTEYAGMQMRLLPPGRLWRFVDGLLRPLLLASATELARLTDRAAVLVRESIPAGADELLPEYEAEFELAATGTNAERQARVVARELAEQGFRPADLQSTLAPILGLAPADVQVLERTHAMSVAMGDEREIFTYFVYRDPSLPGTYDVDGAQALLYDIEHSHTDGHVIESIAFCCDDPQSLCERDLLGA